MKKNVFTNFIKKHILIIAITLCMAIIYGIMLFTNGPWYDELYTYYSFICRGPVYAAIHWPVPNNHVGYSVLSAFLNIFGNSYISLRGVSYIAALTNIVLIYVFVSMFFKKEYGVLSALIYIGAWQVHNLAIQGRGYSTAVTCYLTATITCYLICSGKDRLKNYIIFAIALTLGLYILPSSVYWVMPICIVGGIYLLINKEYKILFRLILSGIVAAVMTVGLYTIIWLAIGSNLISKNPESMYYGVYQVSIILKNPLLAVKTGIEYMLATPYIQSIDRVDAVKGMFGYFVDFFNLCYAGHGVLICIVYLLIIVVTVWSFIKAYKEKRNDSWIQMYIFISLILVPFILMIQSVHPYKRVISFIMVPLAVGVVYVISSLADNIKKENIRKICRVVLIVATIIYVSVRMGTYDFRGPLADRENEIKKVLDQVDVSDISSIYYTDDYQKYVLKFYYNVEPVECSLEEAKYVIVAKELMDDTYQSASWPLLQAYDMGFNERVSANFGCVGRTESYMVYRAK